MKQLLNEMPSEEYHASEGVSKSMLDRINQSPAHLQAYQQVAFEQTAAMLLGEIAHVLTLEGDAVFNEYYAVKPEGIDRRTKAGKEAYSKFEMENINKRVIARDVYDNAKAIADAVAQHPIASKLLSKGKPEVSAMWEYGDQQCRSRFDWLRDDGAIVDLKTTNDASPKGFAKSVGNYRYHVQDAFYSDAYENIVGAPPKGFVFIAVEKKPPYAIGVYVLSDEARDAGRSAYIDNINTYMDCEVSGEWKGYSEKIEELTIPEWAL